MYQAQKSMRKVTPMQNNINGKTTLATAYNDAFKLS